MRSLIFLAAALCLSSCHSQKQMTESVDVQQTQSTTINDVLTRIDSTFVALNADIDSPEIVIQHADSVRVVVRARRVALASARRNAVVTTAVTEAAQQQSVTAASSTVITEKPRTAAPAAWLTYLAWALVLILSLKLLSQKLSWKLT